MDIAEIFSDYGDIELDTGGVKLETNIGRVSTQQTQYHSDDPLYKRFKIQGVRQEAEENRSSRGTSVLDQEQSPVDDANLCSTSSICAAPLVRQFWKVGSYNDDLVPKSRAKLGSSYLHIHPKFLHSNATSHKWAFGAIAELIDNVVDEKRSDGNGFQTSTMRLGADVIVFSRYLTGNTLTQSIGLLSYTFLTRAGYDRIVVPMVHYSFNFMTGNFDPMQSQSTNLDIMLKWFPYSTEQELPSQFETVGSHGTRVVIYNLWQDEDSNVELDFESDPEDICITWDGNGTLKEGSKKAANEQHIANRLRYSLRVPWNNERPLDTKEFNTIIGAWFTLWRQV